MAICSNVYTKRRGTAVAITTLSSREFNQDTSGAKKAAQRGPVFITDRGRPAHVLLTIEDYQRLTGGHMSLAEAVANRMPTLISIRRASVAVSSSRSISSDVSARYQRHFRTQTTGQGRPQCRRVG